MANSFVVELVVMTEVETHEKVPAAAMVLPGAEWAKAYRQAAQKIFETVVEGLVEDPADIALAISEVGESEVAVATAPNESVEQKSPQQTAVAASTR